MMNTAFIPSAGFGTRMEELVANTPKPMLPVGGRPMIDYTLFHLYLMGIERCVINTHYKKEPLMEHLAGFPHFPITFSDEPEQILLLAGGIKTALSKLNSIPDQIIVMNPDTILLPDHERPFFVRDIPSSAGSVLFLQKKDPRSTETGFRVPEHSRESTDCSLQRIRYNSRSNEDFSICPIEFDRQTGDYYYIGKSIVRTEILKDTPTGEPADIVPVWKNLAEKNRLYGHYFNGVVLDVGTKDKYLKHKDHFPLPEGMVSSWNRFISSWS